MLNLELMQKLKLENYNAWCENPKDKDIMDALYLELTEAIQELIKSKYEIQWLTYKLTDDELGLEVLKLRYKHEFLHGKYHIPLHDVGE